jgi:hypothetical protein
MKPTAVEIARAKSEVLRRERVLLVPQFEAIAAEFGQTMRVTVDSDGTIIGTPRTGVLAAFGVPTRYRLLRRTGDIGLSEPLRMPFVRVRRLDVVEAWTEACSKWFGPRTAVVDQLVAEMTETGKQS